MRVLVTGADGFTGRYLTNALVSRGHEVIAFAADITDASATRDAVAAAAADAVIHLAAIAFIHSNDFRGFYAVNQLGTFNLLDAVACEVPNAHVLLASSANIYGNSTGGYLSEETPPDPANHYAASKWGMEIGSRLWSSKLHLTIVRPFNYTGVGQEDRYLIPKIVSHFQRGETRIELGNLDVSRDFGDVRSVVDAYCGLVERRCEGTFNVCTGKLYSLRHILELGCKLTGRTIDVQVNPQFVRVGDPPLLGGNPGRLQAALLDWRPRPLQDTVAWMLGSSVVTT